MFLRIKITLRMVEKVKSHLRFCKGGTTLKWIEKLDNLCFSGSILETLIARMKITLQKSGKLEPSFVSVRVVETSDGIQGVRTGSREPVLAMPGYSANPFLLFVIDLLIDAAILSKPVLTVCYSSYNLFETVAYPRRIEN